MSDKKHENHNERKGYEWVRSQPVGDGRKIVRVPVEHHNKQSDGKKADGGSGKTDGQQRK